MYFIEATAALFVRISPRPYSASSTPINTGSTFVGVAYQSPTILCLQAAAEWWKLTLVPQLWSSTSPTAGSAASRLLGRCFESRGVATRRMPFETSLFSFAQAYDSENPREEHQLLERVLQEHGPDFKLLRSRMKRCLSDHGDV
jgi:hypothetical protein